jgi:putative glutamine amidotransferase
MRSACALLLFLEKDQTGTAMRKPLIGLTCTRNPSNTGNPALAVDEAYTRAVSQAGGLPVLVPLGLNDETLREIISHLDGILFTGGGDVAPGQYGSPDHPLVHSIDLDRDRVEISLFHEATSRELPLLGICRGLQLINVACGGTLYEDILDQKPGALQHQWGGLQPRHYHAHSVEVADGSCLHKVLDAPTISVNSLHHQGINRLGQGLISSAYSPDGLIEGIELSGYPYGLAVQWHPEWLPDQAEMRQLFRSLVEATGGGLDR